MRFERPKDYKIKRKFLFFPRTIKYWDEKNKEYRLQIRWLEIAYMEYKSDLWDGWYFNRFVTKEEYEKWKASY